jgi:hypothetical protein
MLPTDCLHLLTIDFASANTAAGLALAFTEDERRELLLAAGSRGIPLILLQSARSFHLISTSQNHVRAFRPALAQVHERTRAVEGARALPVNIARGCDAARQLLHHATPFSQQRAEAQQFVVDLRAAGSLASECGALSTELAALLRMAERTAGRVHDETRLGRPGAVEAEAELEALVAERIVEEGLLAWQSSDPTLRASLRPPISEHDIELFSAEEPHSVVRLKTARVLTKLGVG